MIDFRAIAASANLPDLALKAGIALKPNGREFHGCCPFHSEKTPSFQIYPSNKGGWNFVCHGCGAKGNAIDFMAEAYGVQPKEAAKLISGETNFDGPRDNIKSPAYVGTDPYADLRIGRPGDYAQLIYAGEKTPEIWNPKRARWSSYTPSMVFPYADKHADLIGYVIRVDLDTGKKMTPQVFWTVNTKTGEEHWSHYPHPTPRPLYNLPDVYEHPDRQILIVEGEKAADAAKRLFSDRLVCISWMGGGQVVAKTYWKSIAGRSVLLWPDNDEPGRLAMFAVAEALKPLGCRIKHIDVKPEDGDKGQDIADLEPLGRDHVEKYMRERIKVLQYATNDANV